MKKDTEPNPSMQGSINNPRPTHMADNVGLDHTQFNLNADEKDAISHVQDVGRKVRAGLLPEKALLNAQADAILALCDMPISRKQARIIVARVHADMRKRNGVDHD